MVTLKQIMGFLLLATVVWLAWVLAVQGGAMAVVTLLGVLLVLGFAGWMKGRWGSLSQSSGRRRAVTVLAALLILIGASAGVGGVRLLAAPEKQAAASSGGLIWQPYSDRLLADLRRDQPVLVDFTAAWCLSCQVNERVAFGDAQVQARLNELNVATLKADWTNRDPAITRALARLDRNSVPVYALYIPGQSQPHLLPEILTPGIVLNALRKLEESPTPAPSESNNEEIASHLTKEKQS
jgi:thiol:disulfide interchange protein DsbD